MQRRPPTAADGDPACEPPVPHQSLLALFLRFLRFGCLAFGGPVAQIGMLQRELVTEQRWVSPERFRRALAVYQVLPGPEAHELCVWFGMVARGRVGAVLAGLGFMLPGFLLMLALSVLYVGHPQRIAEWGPVFRGLQAAVAALVVRALFRIGGHALHDRWLFGIGAIACGATVLGVHFTVPLVAGGAVFALLRTRRWWAAGAVAAAAAGAALLLAAWGGAMAEGSGAGAAATPSTPMLFVSGLRSGLLTFGGAYTVIPFLQNDAVTVGGWMTDAQFLDGVGLSGVLPAPLIIFATFVGYQGGGLAGSLAMTAGIFLPAFCFTLLGHGLFERLTGNESVHGFLDGVTAAVVGVMAATTIGLVRAGVTDPATAAIAAAGCAVLWRWKHRAAVPLVVCAGGLAGLFVCG